MNDEATLAAHFRAQPSGVDLPPTGTWNQRNYLIAPAAAKSSRIGIGGQL
ncbi:hypothetical protein [Sinorhizobium meliloti]